MAIPVALKIAKAVGFRRIIKVACFLLALIMIAPVTAIAGTIGLFAFTVTAAQASPAQQGCAPAPKDPKTNKPAEQNNCVGSMLAPVDDYPYRAECAANGPDWHEYDGVFSPFRYAYCNCTDFAVWRINRDGGAPNPLPDGTWTYNWGNIPGGHAKEFYTGWQSKGWPVYKDPKPGYLFVWPHGTYGHIGYVQAVAPDGTMTIEDYNANRHAYRVTQITPAQRASGVWATAVYLPMPFNVPNGLPRAGDTPNKAG